MPDEEFYRYKHDQAKAWLEGIRGHIRRIELLEQIIEEHRQRIGGLRAIDYTVPRVSASAEPDPMTDAVAALQEKIAEYCAEQRDLAYERADAHSRISTLPDDAEASALERYYLLAQPWERVAADMGYSWDGMMSLRRRAVTDAYDVMPAHLRDPLHPAI